MEVLKISSANYLRNVYLIYKIVSSLSDIHAYIHINNMYILIYIDSIIDITSQLFKTGCGGAY